MSSESLRLCQASADSDTTSRPAKMRRYVKLSNKVHLAVLAYIYGGQGQRYLLQKSQFPTGLPVVC
eukprot:scaffold119797_cov17-Prasinocladus_malaysianus.AAC.1